MSIWTFVSNLSDLNIHTTVKKNYIKIMPSSTPHQKFFFYHLPTRGRAGIKLGDAWYVSNVSIIFDCSMLYYLLFWAILGFIIHFYITFGTNLLTGGPAQICCFMPISVFRGKGISDGVKTERNQLEKLILEGNQPDGLGVHVRGVPGCPRGWQAPPWARPLPRGLLFCVLMEGPSLLGLVRWENHVPEGFIPFGLRLIFLFFETLK